MVKAPTQIRPHMFHHLDDKEQKNYIYFSPHTSGKIGRILKIDPKLLPAFLSYVDPDSHEGKVTIRKIAELRAMAGTIGSMNNVYCAFEHMSVINNIQVYYQIRGGVVYITNITSDYKGNMKQAGLYDVYQSFGGGNSQALLIKDGKLPQGTTSVYICGVVSNFDDAVERSQECRDKKEIKQALFYYPSHMANHLGIWKSSLLECRAQAAVTKLAEVIKKNQKTKSTWLAEKEGAAMLARSLSSVSGTLENHSYRLSNPVGNIGGLLTTLEKKNADIQSHAFNFDSNYRPSYIALLAQQPKILASMNRLPRKKNISIEELHEDNVARINHMGNTVSRSMQQTLGKTFVDVVQQANKMISRR